MELDLKKFRSAESILDFVLTKCGNMHYKFERNTLTILPLTNVSKYANVDMLYIYYADQMLSQKFRSTRIERLDIRNRELEEIQNAYLLKELSNLVYLNCSNNKLTELPELPDSLKYLHCYNNKLVELPKLPSSLKECFCGNNQIEYIPLIKRLGMDCYPNPGYKDYLERQNMRKYDR